MSFRGTGDGTYQLIVSTNGSCCGGDYYEDLCCDTSGSAPCVDRPTGCLSGETLEDVCIIPDRGTCAIITCIGDERSCSNEEWDCFWIDTLADSGAWDLQYVCLDLAPPMGCGAGGDPYPGPCETGN